jgi:hypothetical protein
MKPGRILACAIALASIWCGSLPAATPPTSGTISIEAGAADPDLATSMPAFVEGVADALTARGFTLLEEPGHAAFTVQIGVTRDQVGTASAKVPASHSQILPGGSPAVGVGVVVPFATGKSTIVPLQRTRLDIRIRKRGEDSDTWHGAAVTVRAARTANGTDKAVVADLIQAILRAYPAQPEDVIGVP